MSKHSEKCHCVKCESCLLGQRVAHKENALWISTGALNAKDTIAITERSRGVTLAIDVCNTNWGEISLDIRVYGRRLSTRQRISTNKPQENLEPKDNEVLIYTPGWMMFEKPQTTNICSSILDLDKCHDTRRPVERAQLPKIWHSFSLAR